MTEMTKTRSEKGNREVVEREVVLRGLEDIMFDRYAGDNDTKLTPAQKFYYLDDGRTLAMPSVNIMSFLSSQNTDSAPKRILDARKYKRIALACGSFVGVGPRMIPFTRNGKPIVFGGFDKDVDKSTGCYIHRAVARLEKGIPNPKERPVITLPWELKFDLKLYPNDDLQEQMLEHLFAKGGIALGLGTWRGQFGKFEVLSWK